MALIQLLIFKIYILWIFKSLTIDSFHMINDNLALKQYTFYYESYHYDIPNWSLFQNNSISIIDQYNNTIIYNSSLILSINTDNIIIDYNKNYHFNEIQIIKSTPPITNNINNINTRRRLRRSSRRWRSRRRRKRRRRRRPRRRRRKKKKKKKKKRKHRSKRSKKRKDRSAVARWLKRWRQRTLRKIGSKKKHKRRRKHYKNRYAQQGRFVGYLKGSRRGSTFAGAHKYCKRKYGELASIGNKHENEQVKRVCRVILGDNRKNGYYCWIGLPKPFKRWTDNRPLDFKHFAPNQKHMDRRGRYTGADKCVSMYKRTGAWYFQRCNYRNGVVCSKPRGIYVDDFIVVQKQYRYSKAKKICVQWYGTNLATIHTEEMNRAARRACVSAASNGHCWIGLEAPFKIWNDRLKVKWTNWAPGEPNNKGKEGCVEIYPSGKWNNIPCRVHRYPICNGKTVMERMDPKMRKFLIKKQYMEFRQTWLKHQQERWMAKKRTKKSSDYKFRQMMMNNMKRRVRQRYKDNLSTKFFNAQYGVGMQRKMGYEPLLTKQMLYGMYYQKYGRFPKLKDPPWMRYWMGKLGGKKYKKRGGKQPQVPDYQFGRIGGKKHAQIYGDLDHKPFDGRSTSLGISALDGLGSELRMQQRQGRMMMRGKNGGIGNGNGNGNGVPRLNLNLRRGLMPMSGEIDVNDRKCVLLGNVDGLSEICVGKDYINIKKYVRRVLKGNYDEIVELEVSEGFGNEISNMSDVRVDWFDFENWKYKKSVFIDEYKSPKEKRYGYKYDLIENVEDDVYYAERYEFMSDLRNGMEECWEFMVDDMVKFCVSVMEENGVRFEIWKGDVLREDVYSFDDDSDWDEVDVDVMEGGVVKCVHIIEMKICIDVEYDINGEIEINEVDILTLHDEDDDDNHVFF